MALDETTIATLKEFSDTLKKYNDASRFGWRQYTTFVGWALMLLLSIVPLYCGDRDQIQRNKQKLEEHEAKLQDHDRRIGAAQVTADTAAARVKAEMFDHIHDFHSDHPDMTRGRRRSEND